VLNAVRETQSEHITVLREHSTQLGMVENRLAGVEGRLAAVEGTLQKVHVGIEVIVGMLTPAGDDAEHGNSPD
jgi:hypothetical protein